MIDTRKLKYKDLKIVRKGLKKCIKKAKILAKNDETFYMQVYSQCALGRITGCKFYPDWKESFIELFHFHPNVTYMSVDENESLHTIYKMVNRLFVSGVFSKEKVSAKEWRIHAKSVLSEIDEQIAKFS